MFNDDEYKEKKEALMAVFSSPQYKPMKLKELAILLDVKKEDRDRLKEVLDMLLMDGKIGISPKGKYGISALSSLKGIFTGHAKGFGFVTVQGEKEDYYVPKEYTADAMDGDTVAIAVLKAAGHGRTEARVQKVINHANETVVGTYQACRGFGFVIPDNPRLFRDIFVAEGHGGGALDGQKVVARITDYGMKGKNPEGRVKEVLGYVSDRGVDVMCVIRAKGIPEEFEPDVLEEANGISDVVNKEGRTDFTKEMTFTIDGADAKDLDDAISLKVLDDGYELGVHIADVSHYVTENSPLDKEAARRGTSVYFVDRVIPMLPRRLSNGICSLNQGCDRLTLSCVMRFDGAGCLKDSYLTESVINVDYRMDYHSVYVLLENVKDDPEYDRVRKDYAPYEEALRHMQKLSGLLRNRRKKRGAVNFDFAESRILLDDDGRAVGVEPEIRNCAFLMIEDFMLAANETVAEYAYWQQLPFLYRNHEKPDASKMSAFSLFAANLGLAVHIKDGEVHPGELQKILDKVKDTPSGALVSRVLLRCMKQANYSPDNCGHFGLSARFYTHFTSPIRRYPDLMVHRILKEHINGRLDEKRQEDLRAILPGTALSSSTLERRADDAERETEKIKKAEYMMGHIGEVFNGVISGVNDYGLFVELDNTVEGMVHVSSMEDDYYTYDSVSMCLTGETTGRTYCLGQPVTVIAESAGTMPAQVDFVLYESQGGKKRKADLYGNRRH